MRVKGKEANWGRKGRGESSRILSWTHKRPTGRSCKVECSVKTRIGHSNSKAALGQRGRRIRSDPHFSSHLPLRPSSSDKCFARPDDTNMRVICGRFHPGPASQGSEWLPWLAYTTYAGAPFWTHVARSETRPAYPGRRTPQTGNRGCRKSRRLLSRMLRIPRVLEGFCCLGEIPDLLPCGQLLPNFRDTES